MVIIMTIPAWILCGLIIGFLGFLLDPDRNIHSLIRAMMLGVVGALQGIVIGTILSTIPLTVLQPSPLVLSFVGAVLLLTLGKITRKAF